MAEQLSIKVKVDLPSAGEIESQLNKELRGMKDIETNVKVKPKVTGLKGLKSEIRKSLNGEKFKANVGVKVTGEAKLAKLAREMEKVRRLANEPIRFSVDAGNSKFDEQVSKAKKGIEDLNKSYTKGAGLGLRKQVEEARRNMEQTYAAMRKNNLDATKANNDRVAQVYKESAAQNKAQLQKDIAEYRRLSEDAGIGRKDINKQIRRSTTPSIKDETAQRLAQTRREISAAKRDWQDYGRIMKEAYSTEQKMAKGTAGRNETKALRERAAALRSEAEAIKLIPEYQERANRAERAQQRNLSMINAKRLDGAYASNARRTRTRGGIIPTMDIGGALMTGAMGIAGIIEQYNAVDKAITKVTKVVPDSQRAVNRWRKNIYKDAAEVGKTAPEFASAVEQWATAGYNLKQSNRLAKQSVMGSFVGEVPVNDMVKYMSVPMKAFQKEGIKSTDIINAMNQVSNKHAIEMDDLGQAYQKASSTVGATGTKFSQLTGIITAAQEGTRAGGEAIGTAYKTIGSRIAKMGTGLTKQDQTRAAFFKGLGVNLTDTNGKLKSTWDVMDQLGKKWDTLSEKDKNTAAQYAAGANHANIFQATMDNWKTARQAMREAEAQQGLGSSGSAYQEMAKQKQSIEFQLKGLQDMWGQFVENITGGRKGISDMLNVVSFLGNGLTKLSANPFLSSAVRWGAVATGMVMARKAMVSLAGGLGSVIMQGKKSDSVLERLTGISSKTQKMKDNVESLREAWGDFTGKPYERPHKSDQKIDASIDALKKEAPTHNYARENESLEENTVKHEKNQEARKQNNKEAEKTGRVGQEIAKTLENENINLDKNGKKLDSHVGRFGKLGKAARVLTSGIGVLGGVLGYAGIFMDTVAIAGMAMNAMGIHPIKALQKAMDPASESAKAFNKSISKTLALSEKLGTQGLKYGTQVENIKATQDAAKSLKNEIDGIASSGAKKFDKDTFAQVKKDFNDLAKANGIKLKIDSNDVQQAQQRIQQLQNLLGMANDNGVSKLSDNIYDNVNQKSKPKKGQSWQDLLYSDKKYSKEDRSLRERTKDDINRSFGKDYAKDREILGSTGDVTKTSLYKKRREAQNAPYRIGSRNARIWNSENGRKALKADRNFNQNIRDDLTSMAAGINNGGITDDYINNQATNKERRSMALSMANYLRGLRNSKNTQAITDGENKLKTILESLGKGSQFDAAKKAIKGDTSAWTNWALKQGSAGEAILGVDAQYKSQYKNWQEALRGQAKELSKYQGEAGKNKSESARKAMSYFEDENGNVNIANVDKLNSSKVNDKKGRKALTKIGAKYQDGLLDMESAVKMAGYAGEKNPIKLAEKIADGTANLSETFAVAKGNGLSKKQIQNQIEKFGNGKGMSKKNFENTLNNAVNNGAMSADDQKYWENWYDKNYTKNGTAKTAKAALKAAQGKKNLTNKQLEDQLKTLSSDKERDDFIKGLKKNNQLSKKQWDKYKNADWKKLTKSSGKNQEGMSAFNLGAMGFSPNGMKMADKTADWISKQFKGLQKGFKKDGLLGGLGNKLKGGIKGLFDGNNWKKFGSGLDKALFGKKGIGGTDIGKMFKNIKMPSLNKLNPFKGFKMPKLNLPKGLTTNPFKNWKMPKGITSPLKNLKLPKNMNNPFKNWKMPKGLGNMFKGSKNPFKGLQSSWNKLFGKGSGKNNKVKVDVDTKGAEKKVKNLGKSSGKSKAKIKVDVDTKGAERKIKTLGKSKNAKAKIKVDADTKGVQSKLKNIGKNSKAKVKVNADTKSAESKVKNIGKNAKAKVKVDADTGNAKSKINSLKSSLRGLNSGKHSIHVSVEVSGEGKVKALKSAISGLSNKSVSINASVSGDGKVKSLKSAIASVSNKSVTVSASVSGTGKVRQLKSAIDGVQSKHVSVTAKVSGTGEVRALASAIASVQSKSVTVSATKIETTIKKTKSGSVGITPENVSQPANPLRSMSVVAGNPQLAGMIGTSAQSMGLASDVNSAMNGQKVTDYSDSTQKVSEDYWRYMGNELYTGLPLDEQVNKLEGAVTQADDNMDKLIDLARQRIDLDNKQIAYQKTMQNAYQQQITDMINELHKYGFQNNGNQITNLNHAKDITGDNASKVDDLLSKYQSAYQNFSQATQKIQELQTDIWQQGKNQDDYRNTKDQKMVEKLQRELELLNTSIDNQKNILDRENDSLTDSDYRMKLKNSSDQIYSKSDAVQQLLAEFNKLSLTNFVGTKDADNAKNLADSLSSIKESIMDNLDAIDELKKSIRDIKINALIDNVDKITDNLSNSVDRLKNNVTNLQDGLLSGTTYSDLISSDLDVVNLNQKGAYEKGVNDKIQLERELDNVLDQFAKKNVDRTAQVANEQLQIESQKYDQMLSMATSYARGTRWESSKIQSNYNATTESDQIEVSGITHNQEYVKASIEYQKQLNDLKARYNEQMANADSAEAKQLINQRLVYEQLMLQEQVYNTMIETDKQAIAELRKQFNDPDMNSEQLETISDKITEYENNIMDAQNNIKEAVKSRYDYEKTLLDKEIDDYQRLSDTMSNLVTIADALHLNGETQASIINQQYEATYLQYNNYLDILARLREERSKFEKGSYEWNQLNSMIQEYQPSLESIVTSLLEVNKNEFEQKLSSVQEYFEKNVNEGKTADQAKFDQDVWYNPVQKELRLEEMRLKIVELEDKTVEKRIAALDAQERMSKAEADYVDKQLDLALAEQKLNNTINKKDVRYLEKDENGKFNWTYIADQDQVDAARQEVNKAKQGIEDAKISNRNDYIEKVEKIVSDIKDGAYDQSEARSRLEQLNNSYKFILKDIPTFDISKVEDILKAYNDYEQRNKDIMNDYRRNDNISNKAGYKEIIDGFGEQFKMVSKDLGEIFGKQLHDALSLPNGIRNAYGNGTDNSLTINGDLKVELPDVTNVDEFAKAIATLPQVARQKATSK